MVTAESTVGIETSDVDRWIGKSVGGGELKEPITVTDIRRWVQGMHYPNPIHYDDAAAERSPFGSIVAPPSFALCTDLSHGVSTALAGHIPGSHVLYGGDEWWFDGPRIRPGDRISHERRYLGYKMGRTQFAGPSMFSTGETVHRNQRGERIGTHRSTVLRFLAQEARKLGFYSDIEAMPVWTASELGGIQQEKLDWSRTLRRAEPRTFTESVVGEPLPRRPIGPHSDASFTTEWRAFAYQTWGAMTADHEALLHQAGWIEGMDYDPDDAELDPDLGDGIYGGGSRVHLDPEHGASIGVPRKFGWGGAISTWVLDYLDGWATPYGILRHTNIQYRYPAFEGDVSYLDGTIVEKRESVTFNAALVVVDVVMTNQNGVVLAKGPATIELPR